MSIELNPWPLEAGCTVISADICCRGKGKKERQKLVGSPLPRCDKPIGRCLLCWWMRRERRGLPYMTSANFFRFFDPLPPLSLSQISWFCSFCLLYGAPPPHSLRTSYMEAPKPENQELSCDTWTSSTMNLYFSSGRPRWWRDWDRGRTDWRRGSQS